jgi:hypothetical protein
MKPVYLNKREVPTEIKNKLREESDKALWKMFS